MVAASQFGEAVPVLARGIRGHQGGGSSPKAFCLNALGVAYRHFGDLASAVEFLKVAVKIAPKNPKAWTNLGGLAMEAGNLQEADDAFYYASEALGPNAAYDDFLVRNVQELSNRAAGTPPSNNVGALEVWYEDDDTTPSPHQA